MHYPKTLLVGQFCQGSIASFFAKALDDLQIPHALLNLGEGGLDGPQGIERFLYRVSRGTLAFHVWNRRLTKVAKTYRPDIIIVVKGTGLYREVLEEIRQSGSTLVNFATDDPFNPVACHETVRRAIPAYDLYISTRTANLEETRLAGCGSVSYLPFAYEPSLHFPELPTGDEERRRWQSDVAFIGGADADREALIIAMLARYGEPLDLALFGGYWQRYPSLAAKYRGVAYGRDFRLAMSGARIQLGLVRRANRDGHTMRTFEAIACGAFTVSERTAEHLAMFEEETEAVYFGDVDELRDKLRYYLNRDAERLKIVSSARKRLLTSRNTYRDRLQEIVALAASFR